MCPPEDSPASLPVEEIDDLAIRLAGRGQDGIQSVGQFLARLAGRSGQRVTTFMTIPATVAGGESVFQVRMSADEALTVGDEVDLLVAFYEDAFEAHRELLKPGGMLLYDSGEFSVAENAIDGRAVGIPMEEMSREITGGAGKGKNMLLLGILASLFGLDLDKLRGLVRERFGKKGEAIVQSVLEPFEAALKLDLGEHFGKGYRLRRPPAGEPRVTMDGNQAMAYGLIAAGVRNGAGYPITPATTIMEIMRAELPKYGGVFLQTEDELSAVSSAIGMSYSGKLAVTNTSGPGLSLKLEALSFATMAEIPLICVNVQRGGPSTGIPTQVEQSDLMQAIWGSHGDNPRVVIAARSVEDCYDICFEAVDLALEYSTPVIVLSDQILATRVDGFVQPDPAKLRTLELDLSPREEGYQPYPLDKPTRHAPPGSKMLGGRYPTVTGLEHDPDGKPNPKPQNHMVMTARRREKMRRLQSSLPAPEIFGAQEGEVLVVGWGSSWGPIREATKQLLSDGHQIGHAHLRHIQPLPLMMADIFARYRKVVVVEMNDCGLYGVGQLGMHLRGVTCCPHIVGLNKTDGLAFRVREIVAGVLPHLTAQAAG